MPKIDRNSRVCIPEISELLPIREYRCEFDCGKVFKNRNPYEVHLQKKHGILIRANPIKCFRCPVEACEYNGARLDLLRRHYQNHHMEKKYDCSACKRKFITEGQFQRHRCDVQIYTCHHCSRVFNLLSRHNRHAKLCTMRNTTRVPSPGFIDVESVEKVDNNVDCVESDVNEDVTIDEFEQLIKNIENNVVRDPELIQELAALTPILESLQSN
ncbi:zinc finger protein 468 isoform X2 [Drosophila navojoa]|uniref:zinc finger protein 468 isoform X2 n=1 Tax=Drosophila navojoa TaxID=7232 RepID=UPI0011BECB8C|nr:zinc finger protein 468 isoform X2 [Drosophila navojoa]